MRLGIAVFVIACLLVAGCGGGKTLVGKWQDQKRGMLTLEFKSDGQVTMTRGGQTRATLPYKVGGDKLTIGGGSSPTETFSISGDTLTFGGTTWKRVK